MAPTVQTPTMNKLLYTTYRKIIKMGKKVDHSVAMRSRISCAPQMVYDHRMGVWSPFDAAEMCNWPESRTFLERVIRCLNANRQFYLPFPRSSSLSSWTPSPSSPSDQPAESSDTSSFSSSVLGTTRRTSADWIPLPIHSGGICNAARTHFSVLPFSLNHLNNALAAVKELGYITGLPLRDPTPLIPEPLKSLQGAVQFRVSDAMPPLSTTAVVFQGLSEDMRRHLLGMPDEAAMLGAETDAVETAVGAGQSSEEEPQRVQLLVAHPQLEGYFRHSVMLLVQSTPTSAAAFVINKMLRSERRQTPLPLSSLIRMAHAHGLLSQHLKDHPVMLGGPVLPSGVDRALTLLHRIPHVPKAVQVGNASLWLGGDFDELKKKIDCKEASAQDIVVLCGFAGWGGNQLEGELAAGTWLVATSTLEGNADQLGEYLFELSRTSSRKHCTPQEPEVQAASLCGGEEAMAPSLSEGSLESPTSTAAVTSWASLFMTFSGETQELRKNWR